MMLLSELKADNDSVIMAHCEYLSWKDWDKMSRHCWFAKLNSWSLGSQTISTQILGSEVSKWKKKAISRTLAWRRASMHSLHRASSFTFFNLKLIVEIFFS